LATPAFAKFSRVPGTVEDALTRFDFRVLRTCGLEYAEFAALRPPSDPRDFAYTGGLDLVGELVPCKSRTEALALGKKWGGAWAISFRVLQLPGEANLYLFDQQGKDSFGAALAFDSSMVTHKTDTLERGQMLRTLLGTVGAALGSAVCGYGADDAYRIGYVPLESSVIVDRLRAGELFMMPWPNFHAISADLVSVEEMHSLLEKLPRRKPFKYGFATSGYHMMWHLA
jgi:hypothetical protein